jgi:ABC-2 type transport system ATP-binding protein
MIHINNLQKVIDQSVVIDIEKLRVGEGEIVALVGPTGSGKGVVLDLLTGDTRPTMGAIKVAGIDPSRERGRLSRIIGVVFKDDSLYKNRTVQSNLSFYRHLYGLDESRVREVLAEVGLRDHANVTVDKLPSGLARRLAFGRAILHQPQVLITMEPFSRCDEASINLLGKFMQDRSDEGVSLLVMAEDDANLRPICDRILVLNQGRIVETVSPETETKASLPFKIPVRLEGKVVLVNPGDIYYAEAYEGAAVLHTMEDRYPTHFTLSELEEKLVRSGFFRAHRSYLVNLQHVKEVIPYTRNSFSLRLNDPSNMEIPLSKSAAADLRELLDY